MKPQDDDRPDYVDIMPTDDSPQLMPPRHYNSLYILDEGEIQTTICRSNISKIDPTTSQITYRGHDVTTLTNYGDFLDVAVLLLTGDAKSKDERDFKQLIAHYSAQFSELPPFPYTHTSNMDPVDTLIFSLLTARGSIKKVELNGPKPVAAFLLSTIGITIAQYAQEYKIERGRKHAQQPLTYYGNDFIPQLLQAAFSSPPEAISVSLLNKFLILHAEHGLNYSTLAVRTAASSGADPVAAIIAGMCAFKGPLHGGASTIVGMKYDRLLKRTLNIPHYIDDCLAQGRHLMGIEHYLYKQPDPRATYMQWLLQHAHTAFLPVLPYVKICEAIVHHVNHHPYFTHQRLYPTPALFNGVLLRRIGFPSEMNTLLLCLSRTVGWLAHYYDSLSHKALFIHPRRLYGNEDK